MRKTRLVLVFAALSALLVIVPTGAQMQPKSIALLVTSKPKTGAGPQYEAARKRHNEWHRKHNDTWTFFTWQILSGDRTGQYVFATFGHDWKEFDERAELEAADLADAQATMGPTTESTTVSYYARRADLSLTPPGGTPPPYSTVTTFLLKPEGVVEVTDVIKKINEAIKKSNWPAKPSGWYQLINGGEGPTLVLATGRTNWADFQPPEKDFAAMLAEVYGKEESQALLNSFNKDLRAIRSEIFRYRPDLSYIPASK